MFIAQRLLIFLTVVFALFPLRVYGAQEAGNSTQIVISVDAHNVGKHRVPVRLTLPANAGPLALVFPRWLPGMHALQGPLGNFSHFQITADKTLLAWNRDPYDPYILHMDVPEGVRSVEASYEYVPPRSTSEEVFFGVAAGHNLAVLNPAAFALAPLGDPRAMAVAFSIRLPRRWHTATALAFTAKVEEDAQTLTFAPVTLYTLIDSPIMAGSFYKSIPLVTPPDDVPHTLDLFADTETILLKKAAIITPTVTRLVAESRRMFGTRHYRAFRFMLALSTEVQRNGLEHHESVAYVLPPDVLDVNQRNMPQNGWNTMLIPHEYTHSWNGKFRRPYCQDVQSNIAPQSADLIWVYEGLTQYLGDVLMVRSGFRSSNAWRRSLFSTATRMRSSTGQKWESLADTALVAPYLYTQGAGTSLRTISDVYYEGELIWLEADAIIRQESKGTRSLDDFCRLFFGGPNQGAEIVRYTRKEVIEALKQIQPYDWDSFIQKRFYAPPTDLPMDGFEASGWKFSLNDTQEMPSLRFVDYSFTFGAVISAAGLITNVAAGSLAEQAGLEDYMLLRGGNGTAFSLEQFRKAVRATKGSKSALTLLVFAAGKQRTIQIKGLNGELFPALRRDPALPDLLAAIMAPIPSQLPPKPAGIAAP